MKICNILIYVKAKVRGKGKKTSPFCTLNKLIIPKDLRQYMIIHKGMAPNHKGVRPLAMTTHFTNISHNSWQST